jgi:hypothetical protein
MREARRRAAPPITHAQLVASWTAALAAAQDALAAAAQERVYAPAEATELERGLRSERRWLKAFADIRRFP